MKHGLFIFLSILIVATILGVIYLAPASKDVTSVVAAGVLTAVAYFLVYYWNESSKRRWEEYKRKEGIYSGLLKSISGFYGGATGSVDTGSKPEREHFLEHYRLSWLLCPDEIIKLTNKFFEMVGDEHKSGDRERTFGRIVLAMRRDLLHTLSKKTDLGPEDFKHLTPK